MSEVHKILHEYLAFRKLCTRWVPHNLTDAQKLLPVNRYSEMMQIFAGGDSNAVCDIVTGGRFNNNSSSSVIMGDHRSSLTVAAQTLPRAAR
ncbi:hypothetical protein EVAR_63981_1 [Eumeta japonica]|uniref:Uncharacterized protein n=1 Tax=Eumeta variegata TaxID=151549 RepID=A0A4C1ZJD7_EUMVA|nr:hypothetical protein EVAR_63981_1 [Eumeta japonica]